MFEAKAITAVIEAALFKKMTSMGVLYPKMFNPIPLETYALVAVVVSFFRTLNYNFYCQVLIHEAY